MSRTPDDSAAPDRTTGDFPAGYSPTGDSAAASHAALLELQSLLLTTAGVQDFLQQACTLAQQTLTPPVSVSITLLGDGGAHTVASSDSYAEAADEVQYGTGQGPCLQAAATGVTVLVRDMTREQRWPAYQPRALACGVGSSLSLPLTAGDTSFGALNVYSSSVDAFSDADITQATGFSSYAAGAAGVALRMAQQTRLSVQLEEALASRSTIDQALGILMAQQRCNRDHAFDLLSSASQRTNRKLRDVAADIIGTVSGQPPTTHPFTARGDAPLTA